MLNKNQSFISKSIKGLLALPCLFLAQGGLAAEVKVGGYVKLDAMYSDYDSGSVGAGAIGRDFYLPGTVPAAGDGGGEGETYLDFHARETRFNLKATDEVDGKSVTAFIEFDFLVTAGGNERVSNSYVPRMRHAFVKYDKWLLGQTWTTFQNVGALAENLDFVGPAEGTTFGRQPMIRYSNGGWQFALENPETTVSQGGTRVVTDDGLVPDVVLRYSSSPAFVIAAIVRQLRINDPGSDYEETSVGSGISISGKVKAGGSDDFRYMFTAGSGLGRYVALNTTNAAAIDDEGKLENIDSMSGFVSYRHFWSDDWRSNITFSAFEADYADFMSDSGTESSQSLHINLLHSPIKKLTIGGELMFAQRELKGGADGQLTRLQFSAKYAF